MYAQKHAVTKTVCTQRLHGSKTKGRIQIKMYFKFWQRQFGPLELLAVKNKVLYSKQRPFVAFMHGCYVLLVSLTRHISRDVDSIGVKWKKLFVKSLAMNVPIIEKTMNTANNWKFSRVKRGPKKKKVRLMLIRCFPWP